MAINEIAETDVVTAERNDDVETVVDRMAQEDVGSVVVVEGDAPVGVLTDRSIALAIGESEGLTDATAEDVMSEDLVTVRSDDGIFEVARTLGDAGVRRVPVVDDDGTLEGIVSLDDLVVVISEELAEISDVIEMQSPRL